MITGTQPEGGGQMVRVGGGVSETVAVKSGLEVTVVLALTGSSRVGNIVTMMEMELLAVGEGGRTAGTKPPSVMASKNPPSRITTEKTPSRNPAPICRSDCMVRPLFPLQVLADS